MQYRKLSAAIGSSKLELVKLPAGFGLMAMTFKLGPKAMSLAPIHGSVATVSSMAFPGRRLMSRPILGTSKVISARPTIFFIQIPQKRYMQERPPNQLTLHDLEVKKRKRDEFHDELVTRFDKTTVQRHVVQWITDANLSFRVPEHKGLQKVFQYLNPLVHETSANLTHETLNKYYTKLDETPIYYAATLLHPGIQWSFLTKAYGEKEEWLFAARQLIQKLWEEEYRDFSAQWEISSSNLLAAVRAREYNPFDSFQDELISSTRHGHDEATDELERWLSTKQDIYTTYDNPLEYWSAKRFEYPRVAKMAIDILSVPAMASECEMTFSSAGSMVSPKRSRLDASTIAVTQTVRSWLRAGLLEGYEGLLKEVGDDTAED
ncbi:hypothetical protein FPRO05_14165 [Fusarium proliferatum]|uniref:HAT C-terminal dimerisation domain-containing protein n=1 Tax=Gibberella intermedia TaxID=948311 RepID=A0A365MTI2_GIBIN|nr:hypothetical protein FPRO05_14165 [Fusarium proliferatum]